MTRREHPKGNQDRVFDVLVGLPGIEEAARLINDKPLSEEDRELVQALREHLEAARVAAAALFNHVGDGTLTIPEPAPTSRPRRR